MVCAVGTRHRTQAGYVYVKTCTGWRYEHIVMAEQMLGRPLKSNEVAHHVNRLKHDNRPENLKVMLRSEHRELHRFDVAVGERNSHAKLTEQDVVSLRLTCFEGKTSYAALAATYGVTKECISMAVRGVTWKHVPMVGDTSAR